MHGSLALTLSFHCEGERSKATNRMAAVLSLLHSLLRFFPQAARKLAITEVDLERVEARLESNERYYQFGP